MTERTNLGDIFSIGGDVMSTKIDPKTGAMLAQIGDSTSAETDSDSAEIWQQPGFASLPAPPTPGKSSCQSIAIRRTDRDLIIALCDKRATSIYGKMVAGETCVFATVGQARQVFKKDGHVVTYTTSDNTAAGKSHSVTLGPDGFQVITSWGGITIDENGITLTVGQAALTLTPSGKATLMGQLVAVQGQAVAVAGKVVTCLGPSAVPTLVPGATSILIGATGTAGVGSTTVFCSP